MTGKENNTLTPFPKILIYGYGNPGRQDDGLGNAFIEDLHSWIKQQNLTGIELDSNYQLNIEDAHTIADKDLVIFVDASVEEDIKDFKLTKVSASSATIEFTMHAVSAAFILDLCQKLYQKNPKTYMLHIKGYSWEFEEGITAKAHRNLDKALGFLKNLLSHPENFSKLGI